MRAFAALRTSQAAFPAWRPSLVSLSPCSSPTQRRLPLAPSRCLATAASALPKVARDRDARRKNASSSGSPTVTPSEPLPVSLGVSKWLGEESGLVEYMMGKERKLGLLLNMDDSNGTCNVLGEDNVRITLKENDITFRWPSTTDAPVGLDSIDPIRRAANVLIQSVSLDALEDIWRSGLDKKAPINAQHVAERIWSTVNATTLYAAHTLLVSHPTLYQQVGLDAFQSRAASSVDALKRVSDIRAGTTQEDRIFLYMFRKRLNEMIPDHVTPPLPFQLTDELKALAETKVLSPKRIDQLRLLALSGPGPIQGGEGLLEPLGLPRDPAALLQILTRLGYWSSTANPVIYRHSHMLQAYTADIEELAAAAIAKPPIDVPRWPLEHPSYTVDDVNALEVDDAISYQALANGTHLVQVHVADPGRYVPPASVLDQQACMRAVTIYMADRSFPMLPTAISDACSLTTASGAMTPKPALTFSVRLNDEGHVLDYHIASTVVSNIKRLTYSKVDEMLAETSPSADSPAATFHALRKLAKARHLIRTAHGAVSVHAVQPEIRIAAQKLFVSDAADTEARQLVSEMMILAGFVSSLFAMEKRIPILYRAQPLAPAPQSAGDTGLYSEDLRFRAFSVVTTSPSPHYGLGVSSYTQVTSPLRRYADMLVHHQMKAVLAGQPPPYTHRQLELLGLRLEAALNQARHVERLSERFWLLKWLEQTKETARVHDAVALEASEKQQNGVWTKTVRLYFPRVRASFNVTVLNDTLMKKGDRLRVQVASVDPLHDKLTVQVVT